jgi:adenine C2-methylase RlmN of 23S rRNA A2503 and tRNA A37
MLKPKLATNFLTISAYQKRRYGKFDKFIQDKGYIAAIRRSRSQGICGQLRTESEKKKLKIYYKYKKRPRMDT